MKTQQKPLSPRKKSCSRFTAVPSPLRWAARRMFFPALVLVLVLLPGCDLGGRPGSGDEEGETVTITFAAWEHERRIYEPLAEQFTQENPDIEVLIVPLEDMLNFQSGGPTSEIERVRQIVSGADTAMAQGMTPAAMNGELLRDLRPLMEADAAFNRDDFYPGALERFTKDGKTWVLPRTVRLPILSYNKDLFIANGIPMPQPGWSWNELLATAEQVATKRGETVETYGIFDPNLSFLLMFARLEERSIDIFSIPPEELRLDQPELVEMVETFRELAEQGVLLSRGVEGMAPPREGEAPQDPQQLIAEGRLGMWNSAMLMSYIGIEGRPLIESVPFEVGAVPYPLLSINPMDIGSIDGYIISSGTRHPMASWRWIEFLSRQTATLPGSPPFDTSSGGALPNNVPARRSVAEETGYGKNLDAETQAVYLWALEHHAPLPTQPLNYEGIAFLGQAMMKVLSGEEDDVQKALADAQAQLEETLAAQQLTPTPEEAASGPVVVATPEPQSAPEGATTITYFSTDATPTELRQVARSFREQHPDIFVEIKSTHMITAPLGPEQFVEISDCFATSGHQLLSEEHASKLLDLQPLLDADATFSAEEYPAALLDQYRYNGRLLGLPQAFMMRTLNYNRTAFDQAGIAPPSVAWTVDDFQAAALALTTGEGDDKQYGYVPLDDVPIEDLFFFIRQFGGHLTSGSGDNLRPAFDDPTTIAAIRWYLDLHLVHGVMPAVSFPYQRHDHYQPQTYEIIRSGRAGMWFDYGYGMFSGGQVPGMPGGEASERDFEVAVAPLPIGSGGLSSRDLGYSSGFYISASAETPRACWEWIKTLSRNAALMRWAIPARTSVAQSEEFLLQAQPDAASLIEIYDEVLQAAGSTINTADAGPTGGTFETYWLFRALSRVIEEDASLEQELAEAQQLTSAFMECVQNDGERAECATQADPTYDGFLLDAKGMPSSSYR